MLAAFQALCIQVWAGAALALNGAKNTLREERGDTNFISILIILAVVVVLAGVFFGFKDQIVGQVKEIVDGFTIPRS